MSAIPVAASTPAAGADDLDATARPPAGCIAFWFDYASTYSYLTAMRIEELAAGQGLEVRWQPFLLGPVFKAQGWDTSPFNLFPAKGSHMIRDLERIAAKRKLKFQKPDPFPQHSLTAARIGLVAQREGWIAGFSRAVFEAEFAAGRDISSRSELDAIMAELNVDSARVFALADRAENKLLLRSTTDRAMAIGIFGAPTFICPDGELFWGDDRLADALAHTRSA